MVKIKQEDIHDICFNISKNIILPKYQNLEEDDIKYKNGSDLVTSADIAFVTIDKNSNSLIAPSKLYGHLAASTPIAAITPENSFLQRLIEHNKFGKWFKNGDSRGLAAWLVEMTTNKESREIMGKLGREYVVKNASEDSISEKYYNTFKKYYNKNKIR